MAADAQLASSTTQVDTTSTTFTDLTTMTLTTAATDTRDYQVDFNGEFQCDRGQQIVTVQLVVDGAIVAASVQEMLFPTMPAPGNFESKTLGTFTFSASVDPGSVVKVQWKTTGGEASCLARQLSIRSTNLDTGVLPPASVSYAEIQDVTEARVLGRADGGGDGSTEELTIGVSLSFDGSNLERSALTGDVTCGLDDNATTIVANAVGFDQMVAASDESKIMGRLEGSGAGDFGELVIGANLTLTGDSLAADVQTDPEAPTLVHSSSAQTITDDTIGDVTGMAFTVVSGNYYHFEFSFSANPVAAADGINVTVTTPTFDMFAADIKVFQSLTSAVSTAINASGEEATYGDVSADGESAMCTVSGIIKPSAGGTIQLRVSKNSNAGGDLTIEDGAFGMLHDDGS